MDKIVGCSPTELDRDYSGQQLVGIPLWVSNGQAATAITIIGALNPLIRISPFE